VEASGFVESDFQFLFYAAPVKENAAHELMLTFVFNNLMVVPVMRTTLLSNLAEDDLHVATLVACAHARTRYADLGFADPAAERALAQLSVEEAGEEEVEGDTRQQRGLVLLHRTVDAITRGFLGANGSGVVASVGAGLCTRYARVPEARWVGVDAPSIARVKGPCLPPRPGYVQVARPLLDPAWVDALEGPGGRSLLLLLDTAPLHLAPAELDALLVMLSARLPAGSEIVLGFGDRHLLRPASGAGGKATLSAARPRLKQVTYYPCLSIVGDEEYDEPTGRAVASLNAVSRLFHGKVYPSLVHVRVR
jgi:O-methyltransferase involved in polyketide biosynthesis